VSQTKPITVPESSPRKVGVVESDTRDKTRRVAIRFSTKHPKYGKYIKRRTVLHVHDEGNVSKRGDMVEVAECRPLSKTKNWILVKVLKEAAAAS
jgi:small subunit ribosomal protein S17